MQTRSYRSVHKRVSRLYVVLQRLKRRLPWILAAWPPILAINEYSGKVFGHPGPVECLLFLIIGLVLHFCSVELWETSSVEKTKLDMFTAPK